MRVWKAHAEAELDLPGDAEHPQHLQLSTGLDGRWVLEGELGTEVGQALSTALRLAETPNGDEEKPRKASERRAEALGEVCRFFLDHQNAHPGGRHRPHLNVICDAGDLAAGRPGRFADGTSVDAATLARLACDAAVHRVVMDGVSTILDYGTATRTIPSSLWNALVVRDEGCRFPGCDRPSAWCDGHHVRWVENGGPTRLANLVLACRRHHTLLHTPGWGAHLDDDGTFTVTDPRGRVRTTAPPRALLVC